MQCAVITAQHTVHCAQDEGLSERASVLRQLCGDQGTQLSQHHVRVHGHGQVARAHNVHAGLAGGGVAHLRLARLILFYGHVCLQVIGAHSVLDHEGQWTTSAARGMHGLVLALHGIDPAAHQHEHAL